MKRWVASLALLAPITTMVVTPPAQAQIESNLGVYTEKNAKGYMEPLKNALGAGLANGLYMSAHIPVEGFTARIGAYATFISFGDDDKTFMATPEDYYPGDDTPVKVSTVVGDEASVVITDPGSGAQFAFPGGLNLNNIGLAIPQLTIGGVAGTEATIRWIAVEIGDEEIGDISMFGAGARHSISQYLEEPPLEIAAMIFFQSLSLGEDFVDTSEFTIGVQGSKQFSVVEPYAGLAVDMFSMDMTFEQNDGLNTEEVTVEFDGDTNFHFTLGSAVHLGPLHLNGEIHVAERFSFAFGFALGM